MSRTRKKKFDAVPFVVYTPWGHRCCQHNSGMGWPYFAENIFFLTADGGIATWLYGGGTISTEVAGGKITVREETGYPFSGMVALCFDCDDPIRFPLYIRVPGWCQAWNVAINGKRIFDGDEHGPGFIKIEREWRSGDRVLFAMDMPCRIKRWPRNGGATVLRGPLAFSVKIEEEWRRWVGDDKHQNYDFRGTYEVYEEMVKGTDEWPNYEVLPASPWNYALLLHDDLMRSLSVSVNEDVPPNPWTPDATPVVIKVRARRLPSWSLQGEWTPEVPKSPVRSDEPVEEISLIPLGAARLRMACLPVLAKETG